MTRGYGIASITTLIVMLLATLAEANGGFKSTQAYPAPPAIPVQRAMIVHQDGIETLFVESSFDTPSPDVGWILPLPAEPTSLEAGDPGILRTVSNAIQPRVTGRLDGFRDLTRIMLICTAVWAAMSIYFPRSAATVLVTLLLTLVIISVFLPSLGRGRGTVGDGITIASTQRVGNYDATILRADDAGALSQWLADQELAPLEPSEQGIIDDYIARGWCFVVSRLVREGGGVATPHPLVATFPAAQPVFPMKLTAIGQSDTRIELVVVADQQASAEGFDCVAADRFDLKHGSQWKDYYTGPMVEAERFNIEIGHPDAIERMWDGCVITKLQADMSPRQMDRDVEMTLSPVQPQRQHFYGKAARHDLFFGMLQLGGIFIALVSGVALRGHRAPDRTFVNTVAVALVLTFASAAIARTVLPVIPAEASSQRDIVYALHLPRWQLNIAKDLIQTDQLHAETTEQELRDLLPAFEEHLSDRFDALTIRIERSPGNLALRSIDGDSWLCAYAPSGEEHRLRLPPRQSAPQAAPLNAGVETE